MKKLIIISSFTLMLYTSQAQNLIINGSFESQTISFQQQFDGHSWWAIPGWVLPGPTGVNINNGQAMAGNYGPAQDGLNYVDLGGSDAQHSHFFQDFTTVPGVEYSLVFYVGSSSPTPEQTINVELFESVVGVIFSTTLTPLASTGNINWQMESFNFTASTDFNRVTFMDTSMVNDRGSYIDNVSVTATPEPSTLAFISLGFISLFILRKNRK